MNTRQLLAALSAASALLAAGCGDDSSDDQPAAAGNPTDRAFVKAMVPHHRSAIVMAEIAEDRGQSAFVKQLARDIITTQAAEIRTLRREDEGLDIDGVKVGSLGVPEHMMGMDGDAATLKTVDPFDAAFMDRMIAHHQGAIEMANAELRKGQDPQLKALAKDIIAAQQREITEMRTRLGGDDSSDGGGGGGGGGEHDAGH